MKEKGIEEVFKSAFNNFEADVDPSVWTNVQHAINTPVSTPAHHGANGSVAGKTAVVAGKLGIKAIVAIVAAVTGVSVGAYFLLTDTQSKKVVPSAVSSQSTGVNPVVTAPPAKTATMEDNRGSDAVVASPGVNKIASQQKEHEGKKSGMHGMPSPINHVQTQPSSAGAAAPVKTTAANNAPVASQPAPVKALPKETTPPAVANNEEVKQAPPVAAQENNVFQNDFAEINDYIVSEASVNKGLPNAFSPNGDGRNDVFKINTRNLKSLSVTVFDQSGKLIYKWDGIDGGWDGNFSDGRPAPVGHYYYSLLAETMDGKRCIGTSSLTLTR